MGSLLFRSQGRVGYYSDRWVSRFGVWHLSSDPEGKEWKMKISRLVRPKLGLYLKTKVDRVGGEVREPGTETRSEGVKNGLIIRGSKDKKD